MVKVGKNFGKNTLCPLCSLHEDDQKGLLNCVILKVNCKELYDKKDQTYQNIVSSNIEKQTNTSKLIQQCLRTREELLYQKENQEQN